MVLAVNDVVHLAGGDHIAGAVVQGPDGVTDANLVEGDWWPGSAHFVPFWLLRLGVSLTGGGSRITAPPRDAELMRPPVPDLWWPI